MPLFFIMQDETAAPVQALPKDPFGFRVVPVGRTSPPRNAPCPCGSGKKYKHCCRHTDWLAEQAAIEAARQAFQNPQQETCEKPEVKVLDLD